MRQSAHTFVDPITHHKLSYLRYLPPHYDAEKKYPLVLFLHGRGEGGTDVSLVIRHGLPKVIEMGQEFPFIAISPQCAMSSFWTYEIQPLIGLLDEIEKTYPINRDRVYLTGLSMGGFGAWALAIQQPQRFAALVPICGGGDVRGVCALKHLPIWVFHGALDEIVPLHHSEEMVNALRACGGQVQFTIYPELGHDSWTPTYNNPVLYEWLLTQSR